MPFQPSPGKDDGYDIADYYGVDPRYGTLGDSSSSPMAAASAASASSSISSSITPPISIPGCEARSPAPTHRPRRVMLFRPPASAGIQSARWLAGSRTGLPVAADAGREIQRVRVAAVGAAGADFSAHSPASAIGLPFGSISCPSNLFVERLNALMWPSPTLPISRSPAELAERRRGQRHPPRLVERAVLRPAGSATPPPC